MQKDYETFVEKLEIGIYEATGIPRENISFEKEGDRKSTRLNSSHT